MSLFNQAETPTVPSDNFGTDVYNSLSGVGAFKADLILLVVTILAIIMVVVGIYFMMFNDDDRYISVTGTILDTKCVLASPNARNANRSETSESTGNYRCNVSVEYNIDGRVFTKQLMHNSDQPFSRNEPVELMVDRSNYNDVRFSTMRGSMVGSVMIGSALLFFGLAYLNYYLSHRYHIYSAAQGTSTIVGVLSTAF